MNSSKIFRLLHDYEKGRNKELIRCVHFECETFDQSLLRTSNNNLLNIWPSTSEIILIAQTELDFFSCSKEIDIVSTRMKKCLEDSNIDEEVEFLPIKTIIENEKKEYVNKYWIIHIKNILEAINIEKSKWISNKIPEKIDDQSYLNIIKPNLDSLKIINSKIFRVKLFGKVMYPIYLSNEIVNRLKKSKCKDGMDFSPAMVS